MEYKFIDKNEAVVSEYAKRVNSTSYCITKKKIIYKTLLKLKQKDADLKNIEDKKEYQEIRADILRKDNSKFNNTVLLLNILFILLVMLFKWLLNETYPDLDWLILIGLILCFMVESYLLVSKYKFLGNYVVTNNYIISDALTIIAAIGLEILIRVMNKDTFIDPVICVFLINYYYCGIAFQKTMKHIK